MGGRLDRAGTGDYIAIDVAAGRDRVNERGVERGHRGFEVGLDDAVKLKRLTRREPQRSSGVVARNAVDRQPLARRAHAARQAQADHESPQWFELLEAAFLAQVAVVLLVAAVQPQQL